ncbi:MAG: hypothetical protein Q7S33_04990 [Nanoarchaeota archaeon]|nr:hypothetical protein [Nanoarchaeota archaeon]
MERKEEKDGRIDALYIKAKSIPEAYYKLIENVHYLGYPLRTQYDRKNKEGQYIDPVGKDTKFMVQIEDPFAQPRYPVLSYCERGKYIAEFLGAKDHLVVPYKELLDLVKSGKEFEPTQWPYAYHQRLTAYPCADDSTINQIQLITDKLAEDPLTRRAVAITSVPEIDLFMKQDMPCLREIQLRALENEQGQLVLNTHARWRSRDLYKAWGDNVIGITNLIQIEVVPRLKEKTGKEVIMGPYTEENGSLHIYGQDYSEKGMDKFFDNFPFAHNFISRSWDSDIIKDIEVIPQLKELRNEETWKFTSESFKVIDNLIEGYESGKFIV